MVTTLEWLCRLVPAERARFWGVFDIKFGFFLCFHQEKVFELLTNTRTKIEAFQTQISK